jgi:heme/copper-type cytochrome/quinol oxidase subunit 3
MAHDSTEAVLKELSDHRTEGETLAEGPPPHFPKPPDDSDGGDRHGDGDDHGGPPLSNGRLGMLIFLAAETMFFAGLIGAFLMYRISNQVWPPPTLPRLPIFVTGINTIILLYSAITMWRAQRMIRTGVQHRGASLLSLTCVLGIIFLAVQGYEWIRLVRFGLTMASGIYGATFYTLIGCHALHVLGAVVWLLIVLVNVFVGRYSASRYLGVALCGMYWYYVVALWPVLYGLVYLY